MHKRIIAAGIIAALVSACQMGATLYPINDEARSMRLLHATYTARGIGAGPVTVQLPSGEVLTGEYRIIRSGDISFQLATARSTAAAKSGRQAALASSSATSTAFSIPAGANGMAVLYGDRGTSADCALVMDTLSGKGAGTCELSNGAIYRIVWYGCAAGDHVADGANLGRTPWVVSQFEIPAHWRLVESRPFVNGFRTIHAST
jgi:hypothetical protein